MKINNKFIQKYGSEDVILPPPGEDMEEVHIPQNSKLPLIEESDPDSLRNVFRIYDESVADKKTHKPKGLHHEMEADPALADTEIMIDEHDSLGTPPMQFSETEISPNKVVASSKDLIKLCEGYLKLTIK